MVDVTKLKRLAKKKGIELILFSNGKISGNGFKYWDFDIKGGQLNRLKIVDDTANVYSGSSSKHGIKFKTESELVKFMVKYK